MKRPVEIAYDYIKERILDGTYSPSQKLVEHELAETISVSRNTLKKALLLLAQENLVTLEKNKGATIKAFTLEEINNYLRIREVLEGLIAADAAKNITQSKIEELERIYESMEHNLRNGDYESYSQCNLAFHEVIYEAANNSQAVDMVKMIKQQLKKLQVRTILVPGRKETSLQEHKNILNALRDRNVALSEKYLKEHVDNVRLTIVSHFNVLS